MPTLNPFSEILKLPTRKAVVLDGGFGTELERIGKDYALVCSAFIFKSFVTSRGQGLQRRLKHLYSQPNQCLVHNATSCQLVHIEVVSYVCSHNCYACPVSGITEDRHVTT